MPDRLTPKAELRYNVYGGNVGGPVFIPHVYNESKNRTFFFVNEEWRKEINGNSPSPINTIPAADLVTSAATFNYVLPAFNPGAQMAAGVGNQIFVPTTSDPAFNAKLAACRTNGQANRSRITPFRVRCSIPTLCSSTR